MTATLYAQVCPTCGRGYIEPLPVGLCPVCRFYGIASYMMEIEDRALVMALAMERAAAEPLPRLPRRRRARSRRSRSASPGQENMPIHDEATIRAAISAIAR